jgi:hypothetical protein
VPAAAVVPDLEVGKERVARLVAGARYVLGRKG